MKGETVALRLIEIGLKTLVSDGHLKHTTAGPVIRQLVDSVTLQSHPKHVVEDRTAPHLRFIDLVRRRMRQKVEDCPCSGCFEGGDPEGFCATCLAVVEFGQGLIARVNEMRWGNPDDG